ncbi:hypothetical protein EV204_105181 [Tissierella praeacuta]|uniref:hypothetical protein n=1 Tax=Tissierella praeacuta TaxID=43131 RepID=UPI0010469411|nr:hypothetical protein [Tissierella praeacuta]TCU72845.1 hypothetical protein EV204_105181 [Tissierella praeacuta]
MFNPSQDLNAIQRLIIEDETILELLDLTGSAMAKKVSDYREKNKNTTLPTENIEKIIISQSIIKRSQWDTLATNEKRLCIHFVPDRPTRNESFLQSIIQIDIHVPAIHDFKAWEIQERVKVILHKKRINKKYIKFYGQLGELPTMQGFFCCGSRFKFYRTI